VGEVAVPDVAAERADRVGHPGDEAPARPQRGRYRVEGGERFRLGQVFEQVGRRHRGQRAGAPGEQLAVVAVPDGVEPGRAGQRDLLRADVDAGRVIAVGDQAANQLAGAAADVDDRSGRRRRQQRADVALVAEPGGIGRPRPAVRAGVRLVQPVTQRR
jgi:hypothetical protein